MFKNYFKTAIRNLSKNKFFTTLNVFGLALGMSLNLVYVAMIVFTFQFDNFHPNAKQVYRVITHVRDKNENPSYASAPAGIAELVQHNSAGVEKAVRISQSMPRHVIYADNKVALSGYFVDAEYLSMFNFPLLQGSATTALINPNTMVLTEAAAERIFGRKNAIGQFVTVEPYGEIMVTGIARDMPKNTHLRTEALVSYATLTSHHGSSFASDEKRWNDFYNSYTYLQLSANTKAATIENFLNAIAKERYKRPEYQASFELQRLDKIVPGPELNNDMGNETSYMGLLLMGIIPMIILLAACSNYVSLAISQSLKRMKEFGVRKVMGAQKKQIFIQLVMESTIIMLLAAALAYGLFELIRVEILEIFNSTYWIDLNPSAGTYVGFILFALLIGIFSGIVPALHFTKMGAIIALKGKELHTKTKGIFSIRKAVITLQFMLSLGFTFAVIIMFQQQRYSVNYDLGFSKEKILNIELQDADPQLVKNEFGKLSFVPQVSMSSQTLGVGSVPEVFVKRPNNTDSIKSATMAIDENFIANMELKMMHGSNFTGSSDQSSRSVIINEVFAAKLSPGDPLASIGKMLTVPGKEEVSVIGIVKDFHYASLKSPIENFYFEYAPEHFQYANFELQTTNEEQAFAEMQAAWNNIAKGKKFKAEFLTDQISNAYAFYNDIMKLWGFMGTLAITIACLGLLGTVVFTIRNRVKEVSIRKVMGASSKNLVYLLSKDFIVLLAIAAVITIPSVYIIMKLLMQESQYYHAPVRAIDILISLAVILALGLTTIFSQTMKAANANPVDNLRLE